MKPWVTPTILKAMKERDRAFQRASLSHYPLEIAEYKHLRSSVSNALDTAKSKYLETKLTNAKSSKERRRELKSMGTTKAKTSTALKRLSSEP